MPKRKLEETLEEDWQESKVAKTDAVDKKHSLDSDEEDSYEYNKEHYDIMDDDDIEGQEEGNVGREGGIQITPFNMKEELEEGHFDTEGTYHWKKEKVIRDNWLENIDWIKVKDQLDNEQDINLDDSLDSSAASPFDLISAYKEIRDLMQPRETVKKALQRLGGTKSLSASERLKRKKAGLSLEPTGDASKVTELTELANTVLTKTGNMDIYEHTYEQISDLIDQSSSKAGTSSTKKEEDVLDMYADDFDEKEKGRINQKPEGSENQSKVAEETITEKKAYVLMWEYTEEKNSSNIKGPFTTEQMQKYVDEGTFNSEVWVRKVGIDDSQFYSSKRIDFELYL